MHTKSRFILYDNIQKSTYWKNIRIAVTEFFLLLFLSFAMFKVYRLIHGLHIEVFANVSNGILQGKPYWITYQNRLLGPVIIFLLSKLNSPFLESIEVFTLITIVVENFLLYFLLKSIPSKHNPLVLVCIYSTAFFLIQDYWFYPWDSIDIIVFTLFSYGIVKSKPLNFFLILFVLCLLNKESALFISFYIFIDAFDFSNRSLRLTSKKKLLIGLCLSFVAILYTNFVRYTLFDSQPEHLLESSQMFLGNHLTLVKNLQFFFSYNLFTFDITYAIFIGTIGYIIIYFPKSSNQNKKILLVTLAIMMNILIFGLVNETRIYLIIYPLLIFHLVSFSPIEKMHQTKSELVST